MNSSFASQTTICILLLNIIAMGSDTTAPVYQKGTITQQFSPNHKSYVLKTGDNGYQINNCGDFQSTQVVDYRVKEDKIYIRRDDGKEYKCAIEATLAGSSDASSVPAPSTFQKGTIEGYEIRYLTSEGGFGRIRKVKAYELRGPDATYEIAFCGSFEAGEFTAGQVVEYRGGDGGRLNIRHDNNKEWSCQVVGKVKTQDATPAEETARPATTSPPAVPAPSTAKLSISSVPDGADIEVDGNFSGNTPSDLEVPEGERIITVKKSGYKDWQRKMKVVAGSSIHLNAEMEKAAN
jgi:hypothetical protein